MLIKGLPEQIKTPIVNAGGGMEGSNFWVNSLALYSLLEESKLHKTAFKGKTLFLRRAS